MAQPRLFNRSELQQVQDALQLAEEQTSSFYCIAGREWPRYPYDVRTGKDGSGPEGNAFAEVVRLVADDLGREGSYFRERFRIWLNDEAILEAVNHREDGILLPQLLLYILTHELVHVVRFGAEYARFDAPMEERLEEERRVHGITRLILEPVAGDDLLRVFDFYRDAFFETRESGASSPK